MQKKLKTLLLISSLSIFASPLFSAAFAANSNSATEFKAKEPKIVGGTKAAFGAWPSMVALLKVDTIKKVEAGTARYPDGQLIPRSHANYQAQFCGASLIGKKWVLTAAHCLVDNKVITKAKDINVLVGASNLIGGGTRKSIKNVIVHPDYSETTADNDIALLELNTETIVDSIKVSYKDVLDGTLAMATGWGALTKDSTSYPAELYEVELPVVDREICIALHTSKEFTDNMLCAGYTQGGKDTCQGDSGGPLMASIDGKYQQIGITSWGISCAEPGLYAAYTRLSQYKSWISSKTRDSSDSSGGGSVFFILIPLFLLSATRRKLIKVSPRSCK